MTRKFTWKSLYKPLMVSTFLMASMATHAQYCIPVSAYGCADDDDINSFVLVGENNTSINDLNSGCSANAYADKTALPAVSLAPGATYSAKVSSGYSGDLAAIWVDFNDNQVFESSELAGFSDDGINLTLTAFNLVIPANAPVGNHRMRVTVYYTGPGISSATVDPCNASSNINAIYDYGETHDYTISVIAPAACPSVTNLTATVTSTTATISWAGTGNYIVEYGPSGFTAGTGATAGGGTIIASAASPVTISNLSPVTGYDFFVRNDCSVSSNGFSSNAALLGLNTLPLNDLCSGATLLVPNAVCNSITGTTVGATASGDSSPDCEISGNHGDVWFQFVPQNSTYELKLSNITATNSAQNTSIYGLALLAGDCSSLSGTSCLNAQVSEGIDSNVITISQLTVGQNYYLRIWKDEILDANANEIEGDLTFDICLKSLTPPINDSCINATNLPISTGSTTQSLLATLVGANTENNMEVPGCSTTTQTDDVWFSLPVPASGNVYIQTSSIEASPATDLVMELYTGSCGALTPLYCNDDGGPSGDPDEYQPIIAVNNLNPGTLFVRVLAYSPSNAGQFAITAWDTLTPNSVALNINLVSISAKNTGSSNQVNWTTAAESKGDYFELERSGDGKNFAFLAKINNHEKPSDYIFHDQLPLDGINYYRLKLINADGKYTYSKVVQAKLSGTAKSDVEVYPNPSTKDITVHVSGQGNGLVTLTDIAGRNVYQAQMTGSEMNIDMRSFINGIYFIHYVDNNINKFIKVNKQ